LIWKWNDEPSRKIEMIKERRKEEKVNEVRKREGRENEQIKEG
jgi:hypothetical protein